MAFCVPPEWFERRNLKFKFMNTSVTSASSARVAHQQGLNRVVADRVRHLVEHRAPTVQQTLQRMIVESAQLQDYLLPIGAQYRETGSTRKVLFLDDGNRLTMQMPEGRFRLHDNAVGQAAEKMNVPSRYLRELAGGTSWKRALAARILNEHSSWSDRSRVLVRAVGDEVRGILSDSYRRLDSQRILSAFLGKALEQGAVAYDALWTDTKIYVETILPQPICIPTEFNGEVQIYMGARFSTSDFGDGAVDIRVFLLNGVCLNGMVRENVMKQIHLGGKLPDNIQLSQRTYELDTQTTVSAVNDLTSQLFGRDNIRRKALEIKTAAAKEVNFTQELERLMQKGRLLKTENEGVRKLLMNNNPDDGFAGGPTLWKLTQAITAYARETQPARQRELHELSGELLNRVNN